MFVVYPFLIYLKSDTTLLTQKTVRTFQIIIQLKTNSSGQEKFT